MCVFFQAEDGIRDLVRSRGLGDVYKRQEVEAMQGLFSDSLAEVEAITDVQHQLGLLHSGVYLSLIHI